MRRIELAATTAFGTAERLHRVGVLPAPASELAFVVYPWTVASDRLRAAGWEPRWSSAAVPRRAARGRAGPAGGGRSAGGHAGRRGDRCGGCGGRAHRHRRGLAPGAGASATLSPTVGDDWTCSTSPPPRSTAPTTRPGRARAASARARSCCRSAMLVTALLLAVLVVLPVPYAVNSPGPTRDVLGEHDGTPLIQISGAETYDSTGELRLTTVSGTGGPGFPSSVVDVLPGWLSTSVVVQPVELLYPPDQIAGRDRQVEHRRDGVLAGERDGRRARRSSGYEVPATLVVAGTVEGTDAAGKVEEGDVIVAIDGIPVPDYQGLIELLDAVEPGLDGHADGPPARPDRRRADRHRHQGRRRRADRRLHRPDVRLAGRRDHQHRRHRRPERRHDVRARDHRQDDARGRGERQGHRRDRAPSTSRARSAPIGGIRQKLAGAHRDGATWFLAPASNCDEVVGHVPDGLRVVQDLDPARGPRGHHRDRRGRRPTTCRPARSSGSLEGRAHRGDEPGHEVRALADLLVGVVRARPHRAPRRVRRAARRRRAARPGARGAPSR